MEPTFNPINMPRDSSSSSNQTTSEPDPGDQGSVWKPTSAAKAPVPLLVQRPRRGAPKGTMDQVQLPVSKVISYLD